MRVSEAFQKFSVAFQGILGILMKFYEVSGGGLKKCQKISVGCMNVLVVS